MVGVGAMLYRCNCARADLRGQTLIVRGVRDRMYCLACVIGMLAAGLEDGPSTPATRATSRIFVEVAPGPYYVGQGIAVDLLDSREKFEPTDTIEPPSIPGIEWIAVQPVQGNRARYRLVPARAGDVTIRPFQINRDGRSIGTRPVTIPVRNVPMVGRSPSFLGGVGSFTVTSAVEAATVRLGQTFDYEVRLTGPAAWGTQQAPPFEPGPEVEVRQKRLERIASEPPSVTFRYRLRAIKAGQFVLKPVALAAFDPESGQYATRYSASQTFTIKPPAAFDFAQVDFGPRRTASMAGKTNPIVLIGGGVILAGTMVLVWRHRRTIQQWSAGRRSNQPVRWRREALQMSASVRNQTENRLIAAEITTRLARLFSQAGGRPVAVLTPPEAVAILNEMTNNRHLADRTGRFVTRLDQIRFGPDTRTTADDQGELVAEAVAILQAIDQRKRRRGVPS